jgi:methylmalonyl-CoA/ethylmalonyl-CoA epimerase
MDLKLHHVGVLVNDLEAQSSIYTGCFGYEKRTEIIHDPTQTAYVQFFKLPGDPVYVELVAPDSAQSKLSNVAAKGEGLHHLCYSTENIEAAWTELRSQGMLALTRPVPAVAFQGRRIAWLKGRNHILTELVERGKAGEL